MSTQTAVPTQRSGPREEQGWFDRYFKISARGSSVGREIRGGITTFFTMSYIIVLNPIILGGAADITGAKLSFTAVATVTALIAGVMTILMGIIGRYPFALAAGLGLNGVVAYQLASQMSWAAAMGVIVIEGLVIAFFVATGVRQRIMDAIPTALKTAISVGIGLFIALIGLVDAGFVRKGSGTPVELGIGGSLQGWPIVVFAVGLAATIILVARRVRGGILMSLVGTTVFAVILNAIVDVPASAGGKVPTGWNLNVPELPDKVVGTPDFGTMGHFSLSGSWVQVGVISTVLLVFTLMLADFFDTMGTVVGVGAEGDLLDKDGNLEGIGRVLMVDSLAAAAGGAGGVSSNTTYIESASGVADGARTGVASLVTGGLFLLAMFFAPVVQVVPSEAAAPVLVVVGFLMMGQVKNIDWNDYDIAIPAFLTIILMPFTYGITTGIGAGFIAYVVLKTARGKWRDVHLLLWVVAVLFVVYFAIDPIKQALGV